MHILFSPQGVHGCFPGNLCIIKLECVPNTNGWAQHQCSEGDGHGEVAGSTHTWERSRWLRVIHLIISLPHLSSPLSMCSNSNGTMCAAVVFKHTLVFDEARYNLPQYRKKQAKLVAMCLLVIPSFSQHSSLQQCSSSSVASLLSCRRHGGG